MKRILTAAVLVTAMVLPAFAEGDDSSAAQGDAKGTAKASDINQGGAASSGTVVVPRATTGAATTPANPGPKTGVTGGNDSGGSGGSSGGSGSGGSGGGGSGGSSGK